MAGEQEQESTAISPEHWARIKGLFNAALELPAAARREYVARSAAGDAALIAEVETLLAAHDKPGEFLESVPADLREEALALSHHASLVGERIGAYKIVSLLGTGGMGDVYRAVRDDDQYRAEVAIKLMRADMRNPNAERRFRNERQILASLDHRNIARLLDGGTTQDRLPYVVMELVSGEPIDRYCDAHDLPVRERIRLFLQVCAAVSYAHRHLVVHRDLKPSNILVTADGSAKLLDFGIAKLLESDGITAENNPDATVTQLRAMTLDYASPEQVSGGIVTTVSDVYSLGVVLYRLLTGQSPYRARANDAQRVAEILGDTTPTRPSLVQTTDRREIDADLDNILLMALRKEPRNRYGSVEQFSADLRNYLDGLPVVARGDALRYRMGKFLRRRKVEIAAAALVLLSLIVGLGFSIHEAREAERQRQVAQRHFDSVRKLANTMLFDLHDQIEKLPNNTKARELLVKTSLEYLDGLYQEAGSDPKLREELGVAYKKVGDIQGSELMSNTGERKDALQSYSRSVALLEPLHAAAPKDPHVGMALAEAYLEQGRLLMNTEGAAAALPLIDKTVALSESLRNAWTDEYKRLGQFGNAYTSQAMALNSLGRGAEAAAALDKLVALGEEYARDHPEDRRALLSLSAVYGNAALIGGEQLPRGERIERALTLLRKGVAADEKLVALDPKNSKYLYSLTESRLNLGDALYVAGDFSEAANWYRKASEFFHSGLNDPNDARSQWLGAAVATGLAKALARLGQYREAETLFAESERVMLSLLDGGDTLTMQFGLATIGIRRGEMYLAQSEAPGVDASARAEYRRKGRASLTSGMQYVRKVNAAFTLTGADKEMMDQGEASLARAEAI